MAQHPSQKRLLRVGKAKKADIERWKEGRFLEENSGTTIEKLVLRAATDRFRLAQEYFRSATRLLASPQPMYRFAVSRYYYSMYHAMRAAAFLFHSGDDYQEHNALPAATPTDLPNGSVLGNSLKSARERRNAADYEPYPKADRAWRRDAEQLQEDARTFLAEVKAYLKTRGC